MPLKKLQLKSGVNRENTRYTTENGWYECDKVRFRQGTPEKIGGWVRVSDQTYLGVCRALFTWSTLSGGKNLAVGTNLKYYIQYSSTLYDITPIRTFSNTAYLTNPLTTVNGSSTVQVHDVGHGCQTGDLVAISGASAVGGIPATELNTKHVITYVGVDDYTITVASSATSSTSGGGTITAVYTIYKPELSNPFTTTSGSPIVTVTQTDHGALKNDFVTFSGATAVGGLTLNNEYQIASIIDTNTYTIVASSNASSSATGGGTAVLAQYQINTGPEINAPGTGWGAGAWSNGSWGTGNIGTSEARVWSQFNFGENLIFAPRYGSIYYWQAGIGLGTRGVELRSLPGASDVPIAQHYVTVSDVSRFVIAFGCNDYGSNTINPMLIRWSDQEDPLNWTPSATNQAGSLLLSHGSELSTIMQTRQEILVLTDVALYSLQYLGSPDGWGATLLGDNISSVSPNGIAYASNVAYWMGVDKFYKYDGKVSTLSCDLRQYVFGDINLEQPYQVFAGTNEGFSEIWWFYCSADSTTVNRYVVYNYLENIWYYGNMARSAWQDSGLYQYPVAATYNNKIVYHEYGVDDLEMPTAQPIIAYIESAEFDIDDGDRFGFVYRILPDVTFRGSTASSPEAKMTLIPMQNSGSGYRTVAYTNGTYSGEILRGATVPIEQFTGQVNIRVRGRQMILRMESTGLGTTWQLGSPRIDIRPDGRR